MSEAVDTGDEDRARRLLAASGGWLDREGDDWMARQAPDRRRRPVMRISEATLRALQREPGLAPRAAGGWVLSTSAQAGRPGQLLVMEGDSPRNRGESPIVWLARRRSRDGSSWLTPAQIMAAETLRADVEAAGLTGRLTMDWMAPPRDRTARGPAAAPPGGAARRRVETALNAVGPDLRGMLEAVCLNGSALQAAERSLGLPSRSARRVLCEALTRLAAHYRLG